MQWAQSAEGLNRKTAGWVGCTRHALPSLQGWLDGGLCVVLVGGHTYVLGRCVHCLLGGCQLVGVSRVPRSRQSPYTWSVLALHTITGLQELLQSRRCVRCAVNGLQHHLGPDF